MTDKSYPENVIHKAIKPYLSKKQQGYVMGALRDIIPMHDPRSAPPKVSRRRDLLPVLLTKPHLYWHKGRMIVIEIPVHTTVGFSTRRVRNGAAVAFADRQTLNRQFGTSKEL